jgi:ankyrin repeat protein
MPTLPANPNLDQLRHQAKDLVHAAKRGDAGALGRIQAVSTELTLASAQLALAREHGFASWAMLKDEVDARTLELAERVDAFSAAIVSTRPLRAARMLAETPEIAGYNFATAVLLGDVDRVDAELRRDPGLATRRDPRTGWTALHAACASRLHQLDPSRAEELAAVARMLIDAGADPLTPSPRWTPLGCAVAGTNSGPSNRAIVELLLANGARPNSEDLYLAGLAHYRHELLQLLLAHLADPVDLRQALAAPISNDDGESVRLLLEAGADPRRYLDDDGNPVPAIWAAVTAGCGAELIELLLDTGADPNLPGPDGRTPYRLAVAAGRSDLVELLRRHYVHEDATDTELFVSACRRADRQDAQRRLDDDPTLLKRLDAEKRAALVLAAERADTAAVELMLDLGFTLETRGDNGATALHAAAYSGSPDTVQLLLDRGADIEARDTTWNSTPVDWASVGSGERPTHIPNPDWPRAVRTLLDHGASTDEITLDPDDPKPPSPEIASILRAHLSQRKGMTPSS